MWGHHALLGSVVTSQAQKASRQVTGHNAVVPVDETLRKSCARVEKIEQLLDGAHGVLHDALCKPCAVEVSWKAGKRLQYVQTCTKRYEATLSERDAQLEVSPRARSVNKYLATASKDQLMSSIADLESEVGRLREEERQLIEKLGEISLQARQLTVDAGECEQKLCELSYTTETCNRQQSSLLRMLDSSAREINFLRRSACAGLRGGTGLFSLPPLFDQIAVVAYGGHGILNGQRLAYRAIGRCNLNWAEINMAWAVLVTWLRCVRNAVGLPQCVDFSVCGGAHMQRLFLGADVSSSCLQLDSSMRSELTVRLRPLRDRALLQVERRRRLDPATGITAMRRDGVIGSPAVSPRRAAVKSPRAGTGTGPGSGALPPRPRAFSPRERDRPFFNGSPRGAEHVTAGAKERDTEPQLSGAVEEWNLHLDGGVQSQASSGSHHEYRDAVLLICAAACVTVLEADCLSQFSTTTWAGVGSPTHSQEAPQWQRLERLLEGTMQHLALALLLLGDRLLLCSNPQPDGTATEKGAGTGSSGVTASVSSPSRHAAPPTITTTGGFLGFLAATSSGLLSPRSTQVDSCSAGPDADLATWEGRCAVLRRLPGTAEEGPSLLACLLASTGTSEQQTEELLDGLVLDMLTTLRRHSTV